MINRHALSTASPQNVSVPKFRVMPFFLTRYRSCNDDFMVCKLKPLFLSQTYSWFLTLKNTHSLFAKSREMFHSPANHSAVRNTRPPDLRWLTFPTSQAIHFVLAVTTLLRMLPVWQILLGIPKRAVVMRFTGVSPSADMMLR